MAEVMHCTLSQIWSESHQSNKFPLEEQNHPFLSRQLSNIYTYKNVQTWDYTGH